MDYPTSGSRGYSIKCSGILRPYRPKSEKIESKALPEKHLTLGRKTQNACVLNRPNGAVLRPKPAVAPQNGGAVGAVSSR